jgi:hypothetical protein
MPAGILRSVSGLPPLPGDADSPSRAGATHLDREELDLWSDGDQLVVRRRRNDGGVRRRRSRIVRHPEFSPMLKCWLVVRSPSRRGRTVVLSRNHRPCAHPSAARLLIEPGDAGGCAQEDFDSAQVETTTPNTVALCHSAGRGGTSPSVGQSQREPSAVAARPVPMDASYSRRHPVTSDLSGASHAMARFSKGGVRQNSVSVTFNTRAPTRTRRALAS